jgi:pyruvate/2-oxoglutarate dehydrogenase complex dihydrolipoamide acyltransferase (E2) component
VDPPNRIDRQQTVRGQQAYVYGFKARAQQHHCLGYGTFSVDLDALEPLRKEYSRRIRPITNLPLFVKATALAIQRNPQANAILFKKFFGLRIVHFEQVDVNLPITRKVGERWITFIGTIRNAPAKTLAQIQDEITAYQRCPPEASPAIQRLLRFDRMPLWLARLVHWRMTRDPAFYVRNVGTCGLTLLEEAGYAEYFFPIAPTSAVFGIGGARSEPVVRGGSVVIARVLKCVLMVDHYVISGRVGSCLVKEFKELLESGALLSDELRRPTEAVRVS